MKKKKFLIILLLVLLLSFVFRSYQAVQRFNFDHDNDLASWIVKDIVINHHPRLIGQLTSAEGIYIGPLFYYALIPFYLVTGMDPIGGVGLIILLGVITTFSYYFVFSKVFNKQVGLIGAFLQAILPSSIFFDKRVVPSTPTNLWVIWYFFVVVQLTRGNFKVLPLLGILISLIWHFHIALIPALIAVPAAIIVARKLPSLKQIGLFFCALFITSLPLILFESRHNFSQTYHFINNFLVGHGGGTGIYKLYLVLQMIAKNILILFFSPLNFTGVNFRIVLGILIVIAAYLMIKKVVSAKDMIPLIAWIVGVILFFTFSSTLISEYYFVNIEVIWLSLVSLLVYQLIKLKKLGLVLTAVLLGLFFTKTVYYFSTDQIYQKGYLARKAVAGYLLEEMKANNFPCISVSYITTPGENVGFRYFFWLNQMHVDQPGSGSPIYTIVIPDELAALDVKAKFGHIGVIPPSKINTKEEIQKNCSGPNQNLTSSMLGYTE